MKSVKRLGLISVMLIFPITSFINIGMAAGIAPSPPMGLTILNDSVIQPPPPPSPFGNEGLLSGMTPSKYTIPSGWSLLRAQNFESGSIGKDEWLVGGTVTGAGQKRGNYAARGYYEYDGYELKWGIDGQAPTGNYAEIYLSYYEWTDSNARFDVEYILGSVTSDYGLDGYHRINFNYFNADAFNGTKAPYIIQGEGTALDAYAHYGPTKTVPVGRWVQREFWFRPNTPTNDTNPENKGNGFVRMYEDGVLVHSRENANLNGPVDMMKGSWIMVGGVYTKHIWRRSDGSCGTFPGDGTGYERENNWDACTCPNQCPPEGKVPKFYRQIDDIIVMKK